MTLTSGSSSSAQKLLLTVALAALTLVGLACTAQAQARDLFVGGFFGSAAVVDVNTNALVGTPIKIGSRQFGVAITPDGARAYFTDYFGAGKDVIVVDTATRTVVGQPIDVGTEPTSIAIAPSGARAYVVNSGSSSVSVIDTATNSVVGTPVPVGERPVGIAITPDGTHAFVSNAFDDTVSVIDTATNAVVGLPIAVGGSPEAIAITPDGTRAYVANSLFNSKTLSVIDTATRSVVGAPITVGDGPSGIAITPDGTRAFVTNFQSHNVSVIDTATNAPLGPPIAIEPGSINGIAISPDGKRAYVSDESNSVGVIDTEAGTVLGAAVKVNNAPTALAIVPDQPPRASIGSSVSGTVVNFNGTGSTDPDGKVARYAWDFGDGAKASGPSPTIAHTYAAGASYTATLTVTDDEDCSSKLVFTGQTASCNGSTVAIASTRVGPIEASPPARPIAAAAKPRFGKLGRNKKKGTAKLAVTLSTPGQLIVSGAGAVKQTVNRPAAGTVKVLIKAKGKALRKLRRTGKAKLQLNFKFIPAGGAGTTQVKTVKLLKQAAGGGKRGA